MTVVRNLFGDEEHQAETHVERSAMAHWTRLGRMAEFLVCAELTRLGYYVTHVDAPGFDLILAVQDASLRVQVKSSTIVECDRCVWSLVHHVNDNGHGRAKPRRGAGNTRAITRAQADLFALYHHEFGTTVFLPVEGRASARLPVSQVRHHVASDSLIVALKRLGITRTDGVIDEVPHQ